MAAVPVRERFIGPAADVDVAAAVGDVIEGGLWRVAKVDGIGSTGDDGNSFHETWMLTESLSF